MTCLELHSFTELHSSFTVKLPLSFTAPRGVNPRGGVEVGVMLKTGKQNDIPGVALPSPNGAGAIESVLQLARNNAALLG